MPAKLPPRLPAVKACVKAKPRNGYASRLEESYELFLMADKIAGKIDAYMYEGLSLKLANGARYTPDFLVIRPDGRVELHEVKGHWREAAKVRLKVAADLYPHFDFIVVTRERNGAWKLDPA